MQHYNCIVHSFISLSVFCGQHSYFILNNDEWLGNRTPQFKFSSGVMFPLTLGNRTPKVKFSSNISKCYHCPGFFSFLIYLFILTPYIGNLYTKPFLYIAGCSKVPGTKKYTGGRITSSSSRCYRYQYCYVTLCVMCRDIVLRSIEC